MAEALARSYGFEDMEAMLRAGVGRTGSLGWKPDLYMLLELVRLDAKHWERLAKLNLSIPGLLRCVGGRAARACKAWPHRFPSETKCDVHMRRG